MYRIYVRNNVIKVFFDVFVVVVVVAVDSLDG